MPHTTPPGPLPPRHWIVVANDRSGHGHADLAQALDRGLAGRHELRIVGNPADLARFAADAVQQALSRPGTAVAAHGGDGTLNTVAQAAWSSDCPFGVLAGGTFNYFARTHGLSLDLDGAVDSLANGVERPVQVGLVNGRVFLVNASVGLYPQLLEDREAFKQRFGRRRAVALLAAAWTLLSRRRGLHVVLDPDGAGPAPSVELDTATVFVGNNRLQLEQIGLPEAASTGAGRLAVVMLKPLGTLGLLGVVARAAAGHLGDADAVVSFATGALQITLRGRPRLRVAADGEVRVDRLPLDIRVAPRPLRLVAAEPPGSHGT